MARTVGCNEAWLSRQTDTAQRRIVAVEVIRRLVPRPERMVWSRSKHPTGHFGYEEHGHPSPRSRVLLHGTARPMRNLGV